MQKYKRRKGSTPGGIYLLKCNNGNTRTMCEICSKLTITTPLSLLLTLNKFYTLFYCFYSYFEQANTGWDGSLSAVTLQTEKLVKRNDKQKRYNGESQETGVIINQVIKFKDIYGEIFI